MCFLIPGYVWDKKGIHRVKPFFQLQLLPTSVAATKRSIDSPPPGQNRCLCKHSLTAEILVNSFIFVWTNNLAEAGIRKHVIITQPPLCRLSAGEILIAPSESSIDLRKYKYKYILYPTDVAGCMSIKRATDTPIQS